MDDNIVRVVRVFAEVQIEWVLVGAHAVGLLTEPRATEDFDFIVDQRRLWQLIKALEAEFGELDMVDLGPALRSRVLNIDLIRSGNHPLFADALASSTAASGWRSPSVEALLALKFLAMISPWRDRRKRAVDLADFIAVYTSQDPVDLDLAALAALAAKVYPGAENELVELLRRIDGGDQIEI